MKKSPIHLFSSILIILSLSSSVLASQGIDIQKLTEEDEELQIENLYNSGFSVDETKIDGPDYLDNEPVFKSVYEELKSRYGSDYLPDSLPKELHSTRKIIFDTINEVADGRITGGTLARDFGFVKGELTTYYAGENGSNNGEDFDYSLNGLPDKLTRLSYCFGISPRLITGLIEKESEFIASAVSHTGAVGFMQMTNTGILEVAEQLGYGRGTSSANHNSDAREIYLEYIDCYLKEDQEWVLPWEVEYKNTGKFVMNPDYRNSTRKTKAGRQLKSPYSKYVDAWLSGRIEGSSYDNGLIFGAVLLKFFIGHEGISGGLEAYNNSTVKRSYRVKILERARSIPVGSVNEGKET